MLPVAFAVICLIQSVFCTDAVPMVLWQSSSSNIGSSSSISVVGKFTSDDLKYDVLKQLNNQQPIVVFAQNYLSLEDFMLYGNVYNGTGEVNAFGNLQSVLSNNPSSMLPSVVSPLKTIREFASGRRTFELKPTDELPKNVDNSLIIYRFKDNKDRQTSLCNNDKVFGKIIEKLAANLKSYTGIYTAEHSPWSKPDEHRRIERHILSSVDNDFNNVLFSNPGCYLIYFENVTFSYYSWNESKSNLLFTEHVSLDSFTYDNTTVCNQNITELLLMYKTPSSDVSSNLTAINISMTFSKRALNDWYLDEVTVSYQLAKTTEKVSNPLKVNDVWAPSGFSYHCSPGNFETDTYKFNSTNYADVNFYNFQVQPFNVTTPGFGPPWDCVGFFTIGIWMAIFTVAILIIVLGFGIYMTFIIKTMDRFDDPKGKTISVSAIE